MTTAVLTPEKETVSLGTETPAEQQASMLASQQDANPFLDTRRAWNGVWEESLSNARRWRLIALFEAALLALALFGLIHLGSQPKAIPYVVEVNKLGEVAYSGRLEPATAQRHRSVLTAVGLPVRYRSGAWPALRAAMAMDKKARAAKLRLVVLDGLARPGIMTDPPEELLELAYAEVS